MPPRASLPSSEGRKSLMRIAYCQIVEPTRLRRAALDGEIRLKTSHVERLPMNQSDPELFIACGPLGMDETRFD